MKQRVYLGTYSQPILYGSGKLMPGRGQGIHILQLNEENGTLVEVLPPAQTPNPSYLALHPGGRVLYAVNELKEYEGQPGGSVSAFAIAPDGALNLLNTQPTYGEDPCHLAPSPDGRHLLVANYSGGSICAYALDEKGAISHRTAFIQHQGGSVNAARQAQAHAHSVIFDKAGTIVIVPDLGMDKLMAYWLNPENGELSPAPSPYFACQPGVGPRSGAFHPGLPVLYIVNELASSVTVLGYEAATAQMTELQTLSTLPDGFFGHNTGSGLCVSPCGRFVYASNRGHNSLMVFVVNPNDGTLSPVQAVPTGGQIPRQFALAMGHILVGNQGSDNITIFRCDEQNGIPRQVGRIEAPSPVCLLPV